MTALFTETGSLTLCIYLDAVEQAQVVATEQERNRAEDGERGVNAPPEHRNVADGPGDKGEQKDTNAAEKAEINDPAIADGIAVGANEENGKEDMCKSEPICAVGEKGSGDRGRGEGEMHLKDPLEEWSAGAEVDGMGEGVEQPLRLPDERKGCHTAEKKTGDDDGEAEADAGEKARDLGRADQGGRRHGMWDAWVRVGGWIGFADLRDALPITNVLMKMIPFGEERTHGRKAAW